MNKKRICSLVLCICVLLTMFTINAVAASDIELKVDNVTTDYSESDQTVDVKISISAPSTSYGAIALAIIYDANKLVAPTAGDQDSIPESITLGTPLNNLAVANNTYKADYDMGDGKTCLQITAYNTKKTVNTATELTIPFTVKAKATGVIPLTISRPTTDTKMGTNTINFVDGSITINGGPVAKSTNANLSSISSTPAGTLTPAISDTTTQYAIELPYGSAVPTTSAIPADTKAVVTVTKQATTTTDTAIIHVVAEDTSVTKDYEVQYSVAKNSANDITSFSVPNMIGTATIDASNGTVTASVPFGTDRKAMVATFDVSPEATASPVSGSEFNFETDQTITVKAQDGTERPWTVKVSEGAPVEPQSVTIAGDNTITTNGGTATYTATVLPANSNFKIVTWSIDNTAVADINATTGELTAKQNGTVIITATVVGRTSIKSSKSVTISGQTVEGLSDLKVDGVTLDSFAPDTYNYTLPVVATAASITIVPTAGAGETVTINGNAVAGSYALKPGSNLFTIVVSASGKNSKTYTLTVDREYPYSSTADLEYSPSIFVNGRVTNGLTSNETAYVIVKLMKDGAVLDVVENKVTLDAKGSADYAVRFNKYSGTGYTVKVFVRDTMTNASAGDTVGMDMARPTDATQKK